MVDGKKLIVSASPHFRAPDTSQRIMLDVVIALVPTLIASVILFGFRSLAVTATTVITCVLSEFVSRKVMKRHNTIGDFSAVVTGVLLAFNLPVTIPLWMAAIASVVAIVVVKQFFGGIGQNFVNPALIGRIVLLVSFANAMTTWTKPLSWRTEAVTTATPLAMAESELPTLLEMFLGLRGGCLGETCALTLILGGIYLMIRKVISPIIPLTYIGTVAIIMLIAGKGDFTFVAYQLMSGGLLIGAIFMATDYATSPVNIRGRILFGIGCGLLTALIRLFGNLPEGVSFAIILMNIFVPHIERLIYTRPFGEVKEKKSKKEKEAAKA